MNDQQNWKSALTNPDTAIRAQAAENLCLAGPDSVGAAIELVQACGDDESVQQWAVAALEELGPPDVEARQEILNLTKSTHPLVAYWAATLLGRLGPKASDCQTGLAEVLAKTTDLSVQERTAWALGKIGVSTEAAVKVLKQAATSANPRLARVAAQSLPN